MPVYRWWHYRVHSKWGLFYVFVPDMKSPMVQFVFPYVLEPGHIELLMQCLIQQYGKNYHFIKRTLYNNIHLVNKTFCCEFEPQLGRYVTRIFVGNDFLSKIEESRKTLNPPTFRYR